MINKTDLDEKIIQLLVQAINHYRKPFNIPEIRYDLRGTIAGRYSIKNNTININHTLLYENFQDFLDNTIPHEIAHCIAYQINPYCKPHGRVWKSVMLHCFNIIPNRCHSYDTTNSRIRTVTRHKYTCPCGTMFDITSTRHNKIKRGKSYICKNCRGKIYEY